MTDAITDRAMEFIDQGLEEPVRRPFFLYLAYTAPHWPLHAPEADVKTYDHVYDDGWEAVRDRRIAALKRLGYIDRAAAAAPIPEAVGRWSEQSQTAKTDWIRKMQVYAAMISHADRQIGRVIEELRRRGELNNTLVMIFSDNGASAETVEGRDLNNPAVPVGQKGSYVAYGPRGAFLSSAPLHGNKVTTWEGGIRSPLIVSWPAGMRDGGRNDLRSVLSVLDLAPTLLELGGGDSAAISSFEGRNVADVLFKNGRLPDRALYWEHLGWRAVREGQWKIVSEPKSKQWRLFDLISDPAETSDLAVRDPSKVAELKADWQRWAERVGATATPPPDEVMLKLFPEMKAKDVASWTLPQVISC